MKNQLAIAFVSFALLTSSRAGEWSAPEFCHGSPCPEYALVENHGAFEERYYNSSLWLETPVQSTAYSDVALGFGRLYRFASGSDENGARLPLTAPAIVLSSRSDSGETRVSTAIFVPPDTELPKPGDPSVMVVLKSGGTVYVRVFGGLPTESIVLDNMRQLQKDLMDAGKLQDPHRFVGAGYAPSATLLQGHNEVWVFGDAAALADAGSNVAQ
ncbi:Heme-binding protein 2-like [Scleropages formosus]|uniref:Heme-binding protein 2-like n=1 Tax=Scleropages formosus TaxID=113540 RepID=A0A0P7YHX2_SCLFO|nr:heme-binding protein 2-like [Scleropages formosus]KPP66855.1 Heme-binding protein 2-like [Scleropages formosus]